MENPPTLGALFVFNPTLGEEDTENRKNLFFHPDIDLNRQKDYIGLTEGIINFTRDFSPEQPCEALRCEKTRHAFFEAEPDFWIVLIINNPYTYQDKNKTTPTYLEDQIADESLQAIVKRVYATFRMFNDRMTSIAERNSIEILKLKLKAFMRAFIPLIDFANIRSSMDIRGFNFMPVTRPTFLTIQYIVNIIISSFPFVSQCALIHSKKLIWSGIDQEDMFFLYLLDQAPHTKFYEYLDELNQSYPHPNHLDTNTSTPDTKNPANAIGSQDLNSTSNSQSQADVQRSGTDTKSSQGRLNSLEGTTSTPSASSSLPSITKSRSFNFQKSSKSKSNLGEAKIGFLTGPARPQSLRASHPSNNTNNSKSHPSLSRHRLQPSSQSSAAPTHSQIHSQAPTQGYAQAPVVYLQTYQWQARRLAVFRMFDLTLFLVMDDSKHAHDPILYEQIQATIQPDLQKLETDLNRQARQATKPANGYRFLYFNALNLALVTTMGDLGSSRSGSGSGKSSAGSISMDTIKLIRNIHNEFKINPWKNYNKHADLASTLNNPSPENVNRESDPMESKVKAKNETEAQSTAETKAKATPAAEAKVIEAEVAEVMVTEAKVKAQPEVLEGAVPTISKPKTQTDPYSSLPSQSDPSTKFDHPPDSETDPKGKTELQVQSKPADQQDKTLTEVDTEARPFPKLKPKIQRDEIGKKENMLGITASDENEEGNGTKKERKNFGIHGLDEDKEQDQQEDSSSNIKRKANSSPKPKNSKSKNKIGENKGELEINKSRLEKLTQLSASPVHVAMKTARDGWLVASKATQTQREFFVLIDDKNGNLSSVQEEVNRLARSYFAKIFMH
mmetsp:Transcript_13129/g.20822  ORF Transcript_13129/g.20822 Transcript_13129/m.20822 type:complete len:843 (-) Transcript_13129:31-2559(-)